MRVVTVGEDIMYYQNKVLEWNELFGNDVHNKNLITDYQNYTLEEMKELISGSIQHDYVEVLDAICDCIYTGFMYLSLCGDSFSLGETFNKFDCSLEVTSISLKVHLKADEVDKFKLFLVNFLDFANGLFDIRGAFDRVTESNFSKAITLKDGETDHDLYKYREAIENDGRYKDIFFEYHNGKYIAKAKIDTRENKTFDSGKIVKSDYFYNSVEKLGGLKEFIK